MTVKEVIERIKKESGASIPDGQTCDILIAGDPDMEVTKIGSTFMATVDVIREAAAQGINFIITHEPTWFNGIDRSEWVQNDPVYLEKKKLIEEHHMAIWRYHDHMHMGHIDQIYTGFEEEFGWGQYRVPVTDVSKYGETDLSGEQFWKQFGGIYQIPKTTLRGLAEFFKERASMDVVQMVGNPEMPVERVSVLVGGGSLGLGREEAPMIQMFQENVDVAICGDITEWTLSAYVRDAAMMGMNKGMLVLGHERSEKWGMKYLTGWVESVTGGISTVFLDAGEPFAYIS
ncbi:MAG: Nif3-like dinuclear metal center hexameric protein [Lachnospiraceae bacterium]|nr:Nif3-like dinuclear metal center hexameric protein [Lachnospiraceae bacterium]